MNFTGYRWLLLLGAIVCACFPGGSARAATEWQTLITEEFGTSEVSFYTGQASEAFYGIDDQQRYVIDGLNTNIDSLSALTKNLYYYYAEAECELLQSRIGDMAFCGLVFHYNKKIPGKLAYYVFYIYDDGYYGAKRVIGDNAEVILPLTRSDYIDIDRPNVLAVDARGTRFDLYINGRYVDGFTDVRIDGGGFGFYVSQQSQAAFDNFKVKVERRGGGPQGVESPELLEGSSDEGGSRVAPSGDGGSFPDIPRDPNRPVYPWEVGVDKSETARKERARDREQDDIAEKRLKEGLPDHSQDDPPAEEQPAEDPVANPPAEQPEADEAMVPDPPLQDPPAGQTADTEQTNPAEQPQPQQPVEVPPPTQAGDDTPATDAGNGDSTYINVSLPGQPNPVEPEPAAAKEEEEPAPGTQQKQDEKPNAEEIMDRMRASTAGSDDWSDSAPPYVPDKPAEKESPPAADDNKEAEARPGELKGIELPPLELGDAKEQPAEEPLPGEDAAQKSAAEATDEQAADTAGPDPGALSLFPDSDAAAADAAHLDQPQAMPEPAAEPESENGNPGELKPSLGGLAANDASAEYDPFEGNPDVLTVYDDFTEQRWPVAEGDSSTYRYFGAAYEIDNKKSDTMAISYQQGSFSDARYGVDVEYLGGLDYVGYGLATRFTVKNGSVSYYGLFVSQSGEILLLKVLDGKEIVLRDWAAVPNLSRTLSNRIGMELIGGSLQCIVNGEVVASVTDDSLQSGGYALLCGPGTSTRFDNLTIKGLSADPQ